MGNTSGEQGWKNKPGGGGSWQVMNSVSRGNSRRDKDPVSPVSQQKLEETIE